VALSARFVADFASFNQAVEQAETKLRAFGGTAGTVGASLNRMVDTFSGRRLIEEATKSAEAVDRLGGVSKLSESELRKVTTQAAEAAEKMRLMGLSVTPAIARFEALAQTHSRFFEVIRANIPIVEHVNLRISENVAQFGSLGVAIGIAAVAFGEGIEGIKKVGEAVVQTIEKISEWGLQLRNLSLETGFNTTQLQRFALVTKDFGVDADQLGRAVFQLSRRIAGGDPSATAALQAMGLSIDRLKHADMATLFTDVIHAVGGLPAGLMSAQASAELFGSRLGGSMVVVSRNFDEALAQVDKLNATLDPDSVKAAAAFADSVEHLKTSLLAVAGNALGPLLQSLADLTDHLLTAQGQWEAFVTLLAKGPTGLGASLIERALPQGVKDLLSHAFGLGDLEKQPPGFAQPPLAVSHGAGVAPAGAADEVAAQDLAMRNSILGIQEALKPLRASQKDFLEHLFDTGQLKKERLFDTGIDVEQMEAFKKQQEEIIKVQEHASVLAKQEAKAWEEVQKAVGELGVKGTKTLEEMNAKTLTWLESVNSIRAALVDAGNAAEKALGARGLPTAPAGGADQAITTRNKTLEDIGVQERAAANLPGGVPTTATGQSVFDVQRAKAWADFDDALYKGTTAASMLSEAHTGAVHAARALETTTTDLSSRMVIDLSSVLDKFKEFQGLQLPQIPQGGAATPPGFNLPAATAPGFGPPAATPPNYQWPRRQGGGSVGAGQSYMVGEGGPELFTPNSSGWVSPSGGGGATITVNMDGLLVTTDPGGQQIIRDMVHKAVRAALSNTRVGMS
jgi:hypothetical protein